MQKEIFNLAQNLVNLLKVKKMIITTAESCTGGAVSSSITAISGASNVFNEGFVTYSNDAKIKYLGVEPEILQKFGAVSQQVAKQMAEGVLMKSNSQISIAITGIAGPGGGTVEKPVGTIYLAVAGAFSSQAFSTQIMKLNLGYLKNREEIRLKTVEESLKFILQQLNG